MKTVKRKPGNYYLYDRGGNRIYAGHSRDLRHRLYSYIEKDDFRAHPTKKPLREKARYFRVAYRPVRKARAIERRVKKTCPYNYL